MRPDQISGPSLRSMWRNQQDMSRDNQQLSLCRHRARVGKRIVENFRILLLSLGQVILSQLGKMGFEHRMIGSTSERRCGNRLHSGMPIDKGRILADTPFDKSLINSPKGELAYANAMFVADSRPSRPASMSKVTF